MVLTRAQAFRVSNATCESSDINPISSASGEWLFFKDHVTETEAKHSPCKHPYAPNLLAMKSNKYHGDDINHCNVTYSNLVYPNHLIACIIYIFISLVLCGIYIRFVIITDRKRTLAMRTTGETKPMQKIYLFGVAASFVTALSCIDMQGWADIYSLPTQQVLVELAVGLMHCGLFILTTMWVSISQLKSSKTRTRIFEVMQYGSGTVVTISGVLLGYLEWTLSSHLEYGSKKGTITALKHVVLALFEIVYGILGLYVGIQLLYRIRTGAKMSSTTKTSGLSSSAVIGTAKLQQLQRIARSIMKYLFTVSFLVTIMVIYRLEKAASSFGKTSYRLPPCTVINAWIFFSPLTIIIFLSIFCVVGAPQEIFTERPSFAWRSSLWVRLTSVVTRVSTLTRSDSKSPYAPKESVESPTSWHKNSMNQGGAAAEFDHSLSESRTDSHSNSVMSESSLRDTHVERQSYWQEWTSQDPTLFEDEEETSRIIVVHRDAL
mmetsp:Transcript_46/g.52  ORF Transcript_46/g.52 Transcript_46/m.52 type:complete len:491 (+) Transcript_46:99-1571(+)